MLTPSGGGKTMRFTIGCLILICGLLAGGCSYHAEPLHVHVGECRPGLHILASLPDGSIRHITWSFLEEGLNCDQWKASTWWDIQIQECNGGGYHLINAQPSPDGSRKAGRAPEGVKP